VRRSRRLALALFIVVLASRAPFAAHTLWAHDSALYANALERGFHVDDELTKQRPHPPGYLFYVASAGVARAAGLGSNEALVLISEIASALAAAALFLLARRWMREAIALIAACAFAAAPLVWQYSEIAYPYTTLALGSIAVAAACLTARGRGLRAAIGAGVVLALAGGFRQDLLLLLAPLWLWAIAPLGRQAFIACGAVAVTTLAWLVPSALLSDGPLEYLGALRVQVDYVRATYSVDMQGLPALVGNAMATSWALSWGLFMVGPLAVAALVVAARRSIRSDDDRFFALWIVPPIAVYLVLHIGDWGYVLSLLPAFYLLGGRALEAIHLRPATPGRPMLAAAWTTSVVLPALVFAFGDAPFSAHAVARHDSELSERVAYVRNEFEPRTTLILTREDFLLVRYYLPEFRSRQHDPEPFTRASRRMRTGSAERIVVFTPGLVPDEHVRRAKCRNGVDFVYLDVIPGAVLEFRGERYAIASPVP
jgi:hypothetical protein